MTFSIVGRSPDGSALGVAVASKFLAAGAYVPAAAADAGALATQAHVNLELKTRGLAMLREGLGAAELLERFFGERTDVWRATGARPPPSSSTRPTATGCSSTACRSRRRSARSARRSPASTGTWP